jgi:hypothetical protein
LASKYLVKRTSVSGRTPNTTSSSNSQYLDAGELALNLTDKKLFTSNGSAIIEVGSNLTTLTVTSNAIFQGPVSFGNSYGNTGQFLTSNGSALYWSIPGTTADIPHINISANGNGSRTSFSITGGYTADNLDVYVNGVRMTDAEANVASGSTVEFATAPVNGAAINFIGYTLDPTDGSYIKQSYYGNGSNTSFTVTGGYDANTINVYLNGIRASSAEVNTASGSAISFTTAPLSNTNIYVTGVKNLTTSASYVIETYTGDGVTTNFPTASVYDSNRLSVYLNGVRLNENDVAIYSGSAVVFNIAPANNSIIDIYGIYTGTSSGNNAVNTAAQYIWTNTHIFGADVTFSTTIKGTANNVVYVGSVAAANVVSNAQLTANLANYQTTTGLSGNVATLTSNLANYIIANNGIISNSSGVFVKAGDNITVNSSGVHATAGVNTDAQYTFTNTVTFNQTINGTANNSNYLGGNSAATLRSYSDTTSATAYSNAVSYTDTKISTANLAIANAYSNAVSVASTDATNKAANAYSNATSYTDTKIATANLAIANAYSNATTFASNASNISSGTLAEARLPYRMDQNLTTTNNVIFGNLTLTGNLYVGSNVNIIGSNNLSLVDNMIYLNANNTVANPDLGFAGNYNDGTYHHAGFFRDASDGYWKVFDNYLPEPDANSYIDITNTSFHLANFQANVIAVGNTSVYSTINTTSFTGTANNTSFVGSVSAANVVSNAQLSSNLSNYQTTAGLSGNVATLTANNTSFVGSVSAANVVSNAQLSSNLSNYQTTAGLSANVATLTANNTSFVGSVSAANVVSNAQLSANLSSYLPLAGSSMTGMIVGRPNGGGSVAASTDTGSLSVRGNTSSDSATISFHRPGLYAINMGLDTDNVFKLGGWSDGSGIYRAEIAAPGGTSIVNSSLNVVGTLSNKYGSLTIPDISLYSVPPGKTKATYSCTGAQQTFVVPSGVTAIYVKMWGAGGGGGVSGGWGYGSDGGGGGCSIGLIPVTAGETLYLVVGRGGQTNYASGQTLVYGGGGGLKNNSDNRYAAAGGGYTGIFRTSVTQGNALMIAGGGGGGGSSRAGAGNFGGAGGGLQGQIGGSSYDGKYNYGGGGGTQSAGGTGISQAGGALYGGYGGEPGNGYGGGGGGGYWGGAGGGYSESNTMAGGGGGSGYLGSTVLYGKTFSGFRARPGMYDDPDLPKSIDGYDNWSTYASGGAYVQTGGQYTSAGGGGGFMAIYY